MFNGKKIKQIESKLQTIEKQIGLLLTAPAQDYSALETLMKTYASKKNILFYDLGELPKGMTIDDVMNKFNEKSVIVVNAKTDSIKSKIITV